MKALAKHVLVAVITVGLLTVEAATANLSVARAETREDECSKVWAAKWDDCYRVLSDEWGRNMGEYGWIHNYVVHKKKECEAVVKARKECEASGRPAGFGGSPG
ncbi:MAG: hypothetical protein A4E57_01257 [Syntrophorhabdaceae bacterium PtaU1.Bin034]|jgi:hypothetical protein|nr:MAG: hypothetical protein A4E57_01257 [Syntrophorhabdaceae bacterium PtaU1.Bin034]